MVSVRALDRASRKLFVLFKQIFSLTVCSSTCLLLLFCFVLYMQQRFPFKQIQILVYKLAPAFTDQPQSDVISWLLV